MMLEPSIKVWQPKDYEGLEVDMLTNLAGFYSSNLTMNYEFTLSLQGGAVEMNYLNNYLTLEPFNTPLFFTQHPGEFIHIVGHDTLPTSVWTIRMSNERVRQIYAELSNALTTPIFFPDLHILADTINTHLSQLTYVCILSFYAPSSRLERETRLLNLVTETIRHCADTTFPQKRERLEHRAVKHIKDYLNEHFQSDVSLDDLATLTGLNKYHLLETFKKTVGISPHIYQTSLRIDHVKKSLAKGLAIADIAVDTGFADQAHLTRVFKQYVQVTPGQFQRDSLA